MEVNDMQIEITRSHALIQAHEERLQELKIQAAQLGFHVLPHILTEIKHIEVTIADLKNRIAALKVYSNYSPEISFNQVLRDKLLEIALDAVNNAMLRYIKIDESEDKRFINQEIVTVRKVDPISNIVPIIEKEGYKCMLVQGDHIIYNFSRQLVLDNIAVNVFIVAEIIEEEYMCDISLTIPKSICDIAESFDFVRLSLTIKGFSRTIFLSVSEAGELVFKKLLPFEKLQPEIFLDNLQLLEKIFEALSYYREYRDWNRMINRLLESQLTRKLRSGSR